MPQKIKKTTTKTAFFALFVVDLSLNRLCGAEKHRSKIHLINRFTIIFAAVIIINLKRKHKGEKLCPNLFCIYRSRMGQVIAISLT